MIISTRLHELINMCTPLWAGEAEVFSTYWHWSGRTRGTDRRWLAYQCYKELWGSGIGDQKLGLFLGPLKELRRLFPQLDREVNRSDVLRIAQNFVDEFSHYCAFADAYDAMADPGEPKLDPRKLSGWIEDEALAKLRYAHRSANERLGWRAARLSEGGYCTLFSEGMKLAGNGGRDDLIASACACVYGDELGHMLQGIGGLDQEDLSDHDWRTLERMALAQLRLRISMRNAQFGRPLPDNRIKQICAGEIEPLAFDYERAGLTIDSAAR